jgi:hypothetical protein
VSDIFTEVDEDVRREELAQLWKKYGHYLFALACLVLAAVAAWVLWDKWQDSKGAELGAAYNAAAKLAAEGKHGEAEAAFAKIATEGTPGYRALAQLRVANQIADRDVPAAVAEYDRIAAALASQQPMFSQLAAIRAATLLVDTAGYDEIDRRLEPLTSCLPPAATWYSWVTSFFSTRSSGCTAFRHTARELLALSAWRNGDTADARRWVEAAQSDPEAPQGVRQRMELLAAILPTQPQPQDGAPTPAAPTGTP